MPPPSTPITIAATVAALGGTLNTSGSSGAYSLPSVNILSLSIPDDCESYDILIGDREVTVRMWVLDDAATSETALTYARERTRDRRRRDRTITSYTRPTEKRSRATLAAGEGVKPYMRAFVQNMGDYLVVDDSQFRTIRLVKKIQEDTFSVVFPHVRTLNTETVLRVLQSGQRHIQSAEAKAGEGLVLTLSDCLSQTE